MDGFKNRYKPQKELLGFGYVIEKELGEGQYGIVYKLKKNNMDIAVKVIEKKLFSSNPKIRLLCEAERDILAKINNENVIRFVDHRETNDFFYLMLEFANDGDMGSLIKQQAKDKNIYGIEEKEAINYFTQILNGFQALHKLNVVHRDIKLDNILRHRNKDGDIIMKIADLGFAKQLDENMITRTALGTPITKSPEILEKLSYGPECDLYSLGVVFYQMLFGAYPFLANNETILLEKIKENKINFNQNNVNISQDVQDLISRMLKYDRKERIKWSELYNHKFFDLHQQNMFKSVVYRNKKDGLIQNFKSYYIKQQYLSDYQLNDKYMNQNEFKKISVIQHNESKQLFTLKEIREEYFENSQSFIKTMFQDMINYASIINHPNILQIQKNIISLTHTFVIQKFCNQGSLDLWIEQGKQKFNEQNAIVIIYQLILALSQLHKIGFLHNNISPDNIYLDNNIPIFNGLNLLTQNSNKQQFTRSRVYSQEANINPQQMNKQEELIKQQNMIPNYKNFQFLPPEQRDQKLNWMYSLEGEVYCLGLILYYLLNGALPFKLNELIKDPKNKITQQEKDSINKQIIENQRTEKVSFNKNIQVSKQAKNLVRRMLKFKPQNRIKFSEILQHSIFQTYQLSSHNPFKVCLQFYKDFEDFKNSRLFYFANKNFNLEFKEIKFKSSKNMPTPQIKQPSNAFLKFLKSINLYKVKIQRPIIFIIKSSSLDSEINSVVEKSDQYPNRVKLLKNFDQMCSQQQQNKIQSSNNSSQELVQKESSQYNYNQSSMNNSNKQQYGQQTLNLQFNDAIKNQNSQNQKLEIQEESKNQQSNNQQIIGTQNLNNQIQQDNNKLKIIDLQEYNNNNLTNINEQQQSNLQQENVFFIQMMQKIDQGIGKYQQLDNQHAIDNLIKIKEKLKILKQFGDLQQNLVIKEQISKLLNFHLMDIEICNF